MLYRHTIYSVGERVGFHLPTANPEAFNRPGIGGYSLEMVRAAAQDCVGEIVDVFESNGEFFYGVSCEHGTWYWPHEMLIDKNRKNKKRVLIRR